MKLEKLLLILKVVALLTLGPIAIIGNLGINVTGGFWNCPFPLPFIMCNMCPTFCTFGQIRPWLFYGILGSSFLMGRVFCGFSCPGGVMQDLLFKIPAKKIIPGQSTDRMLKYVKYGVAILVIGLIIHATNLWTGLPLMAELWSSLLIYRDEVRIALISTGIVFLVLALFMGRGWCRYLCPLGAWISVFNKYSLLRVTHSSERCITCHLCQRRCSGNLKPFGSHGVWDSPECLRCLQCHTGCKTNSFKFRWR